MDPVKNHSLEPAPRPWVPPVNASKGKGKLQSRQAEPTDPNDPLVKDSKSAASNISSAENSKPGWLSTKIRQLRDWIASIQFPWSRRTDPSHSTISKPQSEAPAHAIPQDQIRQLESLLDAISANGNPVDLDHLNECYQALKNSASASGKHKLSDIIHHGTRVCLLNMPSDRKADLQKTVDQLPLTLDKKPGLQKALQHIRYELKRPLLEQALKDLEPFINNVLCSAKNWPDKQDHFNYTKELALKLSKQFGHSDQTESEALETAYSLIKIMLTQCDAEGVSCLLEKLSNDDFAALRDARLERMGLSHNPDFKAIDNAIKNETERRIAGFLQTLQEQAELANTGKGGIISILQKLDEFDSFLPKINVDQASNSSENEQALELRAAIFQGITASIP